MALEPCRECGQDVCTKAATGPLLLMFTLSVCIGCSGAGDSEQATIGVEASSDPEAEPEASASTRKISCETKEAARKLLAMSDVVAIFRHPDCSVINRDEEVVVGEEDGLIKLRVTTDASIRWTVKRRLDPCEIIWAKITNADLRGDRPTERDLNVRARDLKCYSRPASIPHRPHPEVEDLPIPKVVRTPGQPPPTPWWRQPTRSRDDLEVEVWVACQGFVKDRLRSPRTADFPWGYTGYIDNLGSGEYRVRRYVDAENAFGTEVRTDFTCTVQLSGDSWQLINLDMNPR